MKSPANTDPVQVATFYHFCRFDTVQDEIESLRQRCHALAIRGTIILAEEGINGTIAGTRPSVRSLLHYLHSIPALENLQARTSLCGRMPFYRLKIRLKREIVTMGVDSVDPVSQAGTRLNPSEWDELLRDPDVVVVDTRNDYEVAIGTFRGATNPQTATFQAFPAWVENNRELLEGRKIAMFCTGGIRCEKATAYVRSQGHDSVFHLQGGILNYLETVPAEKSSWQGECFVFDERVSVKHGMETGEAILCRACRHPLTPSDRQSGHFREGISCPHCHGSRSKADQARYAERQHQVELARQRGARRHIGN